MTNLAPYRCTDVDCPSRRTPRREDFVEKKLFEKFGVRYAESWISDQKYASVPDISGWEDIIRKLPDSLEGCDPVDLLCRFGQPVPSGKLAACGVPLRFFDPARIRVFTHFDVYFIFETAEPVVFLVEGLSICDYHKEDAQHRWRLAHATLLRAWQDHETDRSLADQARDRLCRLHQAEIEKTAHDLRAEYDSSTAIGIRFNDGFEFSHGPVKFERVVVWSWDRKTGFEAELCPGSAFSPDSFGDFGLEQHMRNGVAVEDALHGTERPRFRRRRLLLEPLEFLQRGNIRFSVFCFMGGQVLFVHRSNLVQPAPPGERLL